MVKNFDRSAYLGPFRAEMEEHLDVLSRELLVLESHPEDLSPIDEVFRRTHTVKGSARMMGFSEVANLAHAMEDVLEDLKGGMLRSSSPLLDAMLTTADLLRELVRSDPETSAGRQDVQAVIRWMADLRGIREGAEIQDRPQEQIQQAPAPQRQETVAYETVRVDVTRIDTILNLAGELMVLDAARKQWMEEVTQLVESIDRSQSSIQPPYHHDSSGRIVSIVNAMSKSAKRYRRLALQQTELVRELHYQISVLRMLPVRAIFSLIPRAARDLAKEEQKDVEVVIEGEDTEIDREVLERVRDSVLHIVLNAVVHGIEQPSARIAAGKPPTGRIRVAAYSKGEQAIIEIEDDGTGIDFRAVREAAIRKGIVNPSEADNLDDTDCVRLLFIHGFTTNPVVSGRSGRGVGLDIVRTEIDSLKGHVSIETKPGEGTKVILELPITLAFTHILLVEVDRSTFGFACSSIHRITEVAVDRVQTLQDRECVEIDGRTVPVYRLNRLLGIECKPVNRANCWPALLVGPIERPLALVVDRVIGDESVIVKPLGPLLRRVPYVSGGIILGDGRIVLMLSAAALVDAARGTSSFHVVPVGKPRGKTKRILVVDDVAITRELERSILEAAGYQVDAAVDGQDALAKLRSKEYELVITDVEMPRMDGFELATVMKADPVLGRIPIVIVSSRESIEDRRKGMQIGIQAYVGKGSFDQMTLLDIIESLIG